MLKPKATISQMTVRFNGRWLKDYKQTKRLVQWVNFKTTLGKIFGIYTSYSAEIINEPVKLVDGWEYEIKIKLCHKHFLWINYKTEPYKEYDGKA